MLFGKGKFINGTNKKHEYYSTTWYNNHREAIFMKSLELTGQRFGRLTVLEKVPSKNNRSMWRCVCDCGNEKVVEGRNLKKGLTKSCGCLKREEFMKNMNNPPTHKETGTRLHNEWRAMKARCYTESCSNYEYYGARGIKVCEEWREDYLKFKEWALRNGYDENLTLDRIDVAKEYSPENCRWITHQQNCWNRDMKPRKTNTSGCTGVVYRKDNNKWRATITVSGKVKNLGSFLTKEEAIKARKEAEKIYWNIERD